MIENQPVSKEAFQNRLLTLCLRSGLIGFPKDELDQHILMKSAALTIGASGVFDESEINDRLKFWIDEVSRIPKLDHGSLRRWMVDAGYLTRARDGSRYQVSVPAAQPGLFDAEIDRLDIPALLAEGRREIERRKQAYLAKKS